MNRGPLWNRGSEFEANGPLAEKRAYGLHELSVHAAAMREVARPAGYDEPSGSFCGLEDPGDAQATHLNRALIRPKLDA